MECVARVELGMSSKEFYECTWYDWSLWCEKIHEQRQRRNEDRELIVEMFRSSLAFYYNWNRGENQPVKLPKEFWRLSYDTDEEAVTDREPTEEEKEKLQATIKRLEEANKKRKRG